MGLNPEGGPSGRPFKVRVGYAVEDSVDDLDAMQKKLRVELSEDLRFPAHFGVVEGEQEELEGMDTSIESKTPSARGE